MAQKPQQSHQSRAERPQNGQREKILRIGVILGGKIVEERLIRQRQNVTIGQSAKNTFAIPAAELPRSWTLFKLIGPDKYELHVTDGMDGRLSDGGNVQALAQLKGAGQMQKDAQGWKVTLSEGARGKIILGDMTLLFQFVMAPPLQPRPQLPHSVRGSLADRIDPYLAVVLVLSFLLHGGLSLYVYRLDAPREPEPDEIPKNYPKAWLEKQPEPPKKQDKDEGKAEKTEEKTEEKAEKKDDSGEKKVQKEDDSEAREQAAERKAAREKAQAAGALALMGSAGNRGGKKIRDVTGGQQSGSLQAGIEKAREEGGLTAEGGPGKGTKTGGGPEVGTGDGRGPKGPKGPDKTTEKVQEEKITGTATVTESDQVSGELDADSVIGKVRSSYYRQIQKCYNDALKADSGLKGRVDITIWIGKTGSVNKVDVNGFNSQMDDCIKQAAKRWSFPNPEKKEGAFSFAFSMRPNK
jgi:outer membrane biosynthesis protein TonB